eukprot:230522-Pleurochrysis_carterae.AAC.1
MGQSDEFVRRVSFVIRIWESMNRRLVFVAGAVPDAPQPSRRADHAPAESAWKKQSEPVRAGRGKVEGEQQGQLATRRDLLILTFSL